jgi:predicted phage terminase large subunit-like protein
MSTLSSQLDLAALREKSRESLYFFAKGILGYDWITPHIHGPVCEDLMDLSTRHKMFVLPRGWLKTTLCSIAFPIWLSIQDDKHLWGGRNIRVLIVQNSHGNACKKLAVISGQWMKNDLLRAMFPELLPGKTNRWSAESLCLTRTKDWAESTYEAAGTMTKVTSRHYNVIIEDDTVAPDLDELGEESLAPTTTDVENAIGWHRKNVIPLLNNPKTDLNLVVGTRWYDEDLIKYIMVHEPEYKVTTRACRENEKGEPDFRGKLTYPERFDDEVLALTERRMGPYMFSCLYMNTPVRREDMAFKPEWFIDYDMPPAPDRLAVYTTIDPATDPALSKTNDTDYSVVMTCGKDLTTGLIYVLDYFRKKCNPGEMCEAIFRHYDMWHPLIVGYEDVAYQKSIHYWLKEMMKKCGKYFILEPLKLSRMKDAKETRIAGLQPLFANGIIHTRPHMVDLKSELLKFPLGAHDDLPDALSMQTVLWRITKTASYYKSNPADQPFTLENAMASIKRRKAGPQSSVVFDPSRCGPLGFVGRQSA